MSRVACHALMQSILRTSHDLKIAYVNKTLGNEL